jgi:FAD binding domain
MREVNPVGDPALGARVVLAYDEAIEWVRSLDVDVQDLVPVLGDGRGRQTDIAALISTCPGIVKGADKGEILLDTRTERLLTLDGRVTAAEVVTGSGERRRIAGSSTLLATGGFGGDPELRERLIPPLARDLPLRQALQRRLRPAARPGRRRRVRHGERRASTGTWSPRTRSTPPRTRTRSSS